LARPSLAKVATRRCRSDPLPSPELGVEIVGDGAKDPDLALATGLGDGDGDGAYVDIETEVEFNSFHGVVVSSYSRNESERLPRPERGRSCGSAHPGNPRS